MIPDINLLTTPLEEVEHPDKTYQAIIVKSISVENDTTKEVYRTRIKGYADGLESLKQAIYFILGTERYRFPIYSWDYGVELYDLFGKPMPYVISEIPRRIKEALMVDNRVSDVTDFEFERSGKKLHVTFNVVSNYGNLNADLEVEI